jgi:hypothetical protein
VVCIREGDVKVTDTFRNWRRSNFSKY